MAGLCCFLRVQGRAGVEAREGQRGLQRGNLRSYTNNFLTFLRNLFLEGLKHLVPLMVGRL